MFEAEREEAKRETRIECRDLEFWDYDEKSWGVVDMMEKGKERKGTLFKCLVVLALEH